MTNIRAQMIGLERLGPLSRRAVGDAAAASRHGLLEGAEAVAGNARSRVLMSRRADRPEPSELAESIRAEATATGARVIAGAPHAAFVEFGTRGTAARPFLAPALEEERAGIVERARAILAGEGR